MPIKDGDWGYIRLNRVQQAGTDVRFQFVQPDGGPDTDHTVVRLDLPQAVPAPVVETLRRAYRDRGLLGDPDFATNPVAQLLAPMPVEQFFAEYHDKLPLHLKGDAGKFAAVSDTSSLPLVDPSGMPAAAPTITRPSALGTPTVVVPLPPHVVPTLEK